MINISLYIYCHGSDQVRSYCVRDATGRVTLNLPQVNLKCFRVEELQCLKLVVVWSSKTTKKIFCKIKGLLVQGKIIPDNPGEID